MRMMCNKGLKTGLLTLIGCALVSAPSFASDHFDVKDQFIETAFGESIPASSKNNAPQ